MIPSFSIGADFPASWYLIVAIPAAGEEVIEKDMEVEESELDDLGGELWSGGKGGLGRFLERGRALGERNR